MNLIDIKLLLVHSFDGSCRAVLEAMSLGKPLLVANQGILPEYVPEQANGFTFDLNSKSLLRAIHKMVNTSPSQRATMGYITRSLVENHFNLGKQALATEHCYQTILTKHTLV